MKENFREVMLDLGEELKETSRYVYLYVNSTKFEWWEKQKRLVIGWTNSEDERVKIYNALLKELDKEEFISIEKRKSVLWVEFLGEINYQSIWIKTYDILNSLILEKRQEAKTLGVSFKGTLFENLKERGTTISPMFCKMVCRESGMNLERILAEYYISGGRIDGVELDEEGNIVSIYECGSGIHKGEYLDWNHWNKVLCRYLYSDDIWNDHLKRIVLLAGGYSEELLSLGRNAFKLFNKAGIELVLLKTIKENNKIDVIKLEI